MLAVLQFVFEDFWRFLGVCMFLMIFALWKPVEINIVSRLIEKGDGDAD